MKNLFFVIITFSVLSSCKESPLTAEEVLSNSIQYHDPNGAWSSFHEEMKILFSGPAMDDRTSTIRINLPEDQFYSKAEQNGNVIEYMLSGADCQLKLNDSTNFSDERAQELRLTCDRALLMKDYYTYLYGLPMKLRDPGTNLSETVERKTFKDKEYLVLKVEYDPEVGTDVWYFYFDPETYAMEVYQFYKTDENGEVKPGSGEYILLSEERLVGGIHMPSVRKWYYNKDDGFLGTDSLIN